MSTTPASREPLDSAPSAVLDPLLDIGELAAYLGVPVSTIHDWRTRGLGPPSYRFGKHVKFAVSEVRTWMAQHRQGPGRVGMVQS